MGRIVDADAWDRRHADPERNYSRGPSAVLVAELSTLRPGVALDLACGQGRHAVWLAEHGWQVTGVDFSRVALERAVRHAEERGVRCDWIQADLREYEPAPGAQDLAVISYLHLPGDERRKVLRAAARALAPGGTLLLVGLDRANHVHGYGGPSDPGVLLDRDEVVAELPGLQVERAATITRAVETTDGGRVALDLLVRARRPG